MTLLSGIIAAPMIATARKAFAGGNLVVVGWGGKYQTVTEEVRVRPFEKEFGIQVTMASAPDLANVKAQLMANNVQWDVFVGPGSMMLSGSKDGFWEPLDPALFDRDDLIAPMTKDAVPIDAFAGGIAWDSSKFPEDKHPETFTEYFDFEKFPGPRTLRNRVSETLEFALLADGVTPDGLYPLDVERAFRSLERIKPYISSWVGPTPQTVMLLKAGQVNFTYTYPTLVFAQNESKSLNFCYRQNVLGIDYLSVLKNAPNKANAMKYLQFVLRPDRQAALHNLYVGLVPASRAAVQLLTPEARNWLPTFDNKMNAKLNDLWWADRYDDFDAALQGVAAEIVDGDVAYGTVTS